MALNLRHYSPEDLKHLHELEVMILKDMIDVLEKNNIPYFAYGGTHIGALRHEGFIPWDDDVDIVLFREDYEKAIEVFNRELDPDKYEVLSPSLIDDCFYLFSMVSLKGTKYAFWYRDYVSYNVGIHIDFFALDNVPDSDFKCKLYYYKTRLLNHLQTNAIIDMKHSKAHHLIHKVLKILPFSNKKWKEITYNAITKYNKEDTKRVADAGEISGFFAYDRDIFKPGIKTKFENIEVRVPQSDEILIQLFGDYMQIPPEEERYNSAPEVLDFGKY